MSKQSDSDFGSAMLLLLLMVPAMMLSGVILSYFWQWFLVPIFPGIPVISVGQAIGVSMAASLFTGGVKLKLDNDKSAHDAIFGLFEMAFYKCVLWGIGAIIYVIVY